MAAMAETSAPMETEETAAPAHTGGGKVCVAGAVFGGRDELWRHVQDVQARIDDSVASGGDAFFLFALLSCHPAANEKMATGATAIGYATNSEYPDTKSFYVERADGSRAGFSARKCVDELFPENGDSRGVLSFARRACGASDRAAGDRPSRDGPAEPGSCVEISGLEGQGVGFAELREALGAYAVVKYVDVNDDDGTAVARFDGAAGAAAAVAACREINGAECELRVMAPDKEEAYKKRSDELRRASNHGGKGGKGGRGRGRGGRGATPIRRGR